MTLFCTASHEMHLWIGCSANLFGGLVNNFEDNQGYNRCKFKKIEKDVETIFCQ